MPDPLFHQGDLRDFLENQGQAMSQEINSLPEKQILNSAPKDLEDYFVEKYIIDTIEIDELNTQMTYADTQVDISNRSDFAFFNRGGPAYVTGTRITLYVPFSGDPRLFKYRPSQMRLSTPCPDVRENELVFVYESTTQDAQRIQKEFEGEISDVNFNINQITKETQDSNSNLRLRVNHSISQRREKLLKDRGIVESLGFPLRRRPGMPTTYVAPEIKRRITPQIPKVSTEPYRPEPTLDITEYEHILSVITNMAMVMERSPRAFKEMGEEDLRQHFLVQLNGQYEGQATGETFNYEGKTDILIRENGKNIFIAECKFWTGQSGLTAALNQLLGYTSWRDTKIALLVFNRGRNMSTTLKRIPDTVKKHPNYKRDAAYNSETGFRYILRHRDDSSRELTMTVLVFDIPKQAQI